MSPSRTSLTCPPTQLLALAFFLKNKPQKTQETHPCMHICIHARAHTHTRNNLQKCKLRNKPKYTSKRPVR